MKDKQTETGSTNNYFVVWDEKDKWHYYMETAWTKEQVNNLKNRDGKECVWKVISKHINKEHARISCEESNKRPSEIIMKFEGQ